GGTYYLAMTFVDGEGLDARLERDGRLPEAEALRIARTVAEALAYAWDEHRLLHRDVKPANIMTDRRGRVLLMDLGLAKDLAEDHGMTLTGQMVGTPLYMSPEQARGLPDPGVQTDMYGLGATLYHLLTGGPPFTGPTAVAILTQHARAPLPPARERNPEISEACAHLLEVMLAKDPAARHPTWQALIADIDRVLAGQAPLQARPAGGAEVSQTTAAAQVRAHLERRGKPHAEVRKAPSENASRQGQNRLARGLTVATAALLLVALGLAVVLALRSGRRGPGERAERGNWTDWTDPTDRTDATDAAAAPERPAPATMPTPGRDWTVPDLGLELAWVAPGSFRMGAEDDRDVERPVHPVRITRGFWTGRIEVTRAQYEAVMGEYTNHEDEPASHPVQMVTWQAAQGFCARLTERERAAGRLPALPDGSGGMQVCHYRLPTEAEWEYVARGGPVSKGYRYAGSDSAAEVGWFRGNSGNRLHPGGLKRANELGLFDLSGNALEWCLDGYGADYYSRSPGEDPVNTVVASYRVARGGCMNANEEGMLVTHRAWQEPGSQYRGYGFRVVLGVPPVPVATAAAAGAPAGATPGPTGAGTPPTPAGVVPPPAPAAGPAVPTSGGTVSMPSTPSIASISAPPPASVPVFDGTVDLLLAGRRDEALRHWRRVRADSSAALTEEAAAAVEGLLAAAAGLPGRILQGFEADVGRETTVELADGTRLTCEVREVTEAGIRVLVAERRGGGSTVKLGRTLRLEELSTGERIRRLGEGNDPGRVLLRGLLAIEGGSADAAGAFFAGVGEPLGPALARGLERRETARRTAALQEALSDLLRSAAGKSIALEPKAVVAAIRERCGAGSGRAERLRKRVEEFAREHGHTPLGTQWLPVLREALAFPFPGEDWTVPDLGMEFVWIEPMKLWVGKYEVTNGEYRRLDPNHSCGVWNGERPLDGDRQPVTLIAFDDCCRYAAWLSEREKQAGRLPKGFDYRLPSRDEWMAFAQCGDNRTYPWGNAPLPPKDWNYGGKELPDCKPDDPDPLQLGRLGHQDAFVHTCPVEQSGRNDWGLHGVGGNAGEITAATPRGVFDASRGAAAGHQYLSTLRCDYGAPLYNGATHGDGFRLVLGQ
ncbi:MAG: SUMF1/EgtB/PvdO family nonheme iron enzyme, partial [Lentisphaeria bacterium]|nr:SUMF1/EgtB/PvdO family nonheme iron enzyme [Lentisphaeria bacterium]